MPKKDAEEHAPLVPITREEAERRKHFVLARDGVFCDLDRSTGILTISLSPEAAKRLTKDATEQGMDLKTYMRQTLQEEIAPIELSKQQVTTH